MAPEVRMGEEGEFFRYQLLYSELQERIAHLAAMRERTSDLTERLAQLNRHIASLRENVPRTCTGCGDPFVGAPDATLCPDCRGD
ncbi:MAG TPA: hypothetical protein V6D47_09740 [Oscillatoriaceae cyanobacterium]